MGLFRLPFQPGFGGLPVSRGAAVGRLERFEPLLAEIDRVRQIIVIAVAHIEMNLPLQLRRKALPVAGNNVRKIKMIADRKSTRLNSSHANISYAVFCLKKKKTHFVF